MDIALDTVVGVDLVVLLLEVVVIHPSKGACEVLVFGVVVELLLGVAISQIEFALFAQAVDLLARIQTLFVVLGE